MEKEKNSKHKITVQGILNDAKSRIVETYHPHREILDRLLKKVVPIDINEKADIEADKEVPIWKVVVVAVDEVLILAKSHHWGICKNKGFIYLFNGAYWYNLEEDQLMHFLGDVAHKLGVSLLRSRHFEFRKKLLAQFHGVSNMPPPVSDSNNTLINLRNGTLEISSDSTLLRPFDQGDFLTYQLPFAYNPKADAPIFSLYLNTVLPVKELQQILAEYIGYLFVPSHVLKLEKTILLYGGGANGKSVFFDIINALLGRQNVTTYSLAKLTDQNGYYRAMIGNKLVNYASEINNKLDPAFFKQLVSGEPIEARLPYGQPFILENYAKLIFNANELPRDVEHSNAYFRRFLIIPFNVTIPEHQQDRNLAQKIIQKELPGVLNWVLDGLKRITTNKSFTPSSIVYNQVAQYKNEADTSYLFMDEYCYIPDSTNTILLKEIYEKYKAFCRENNYQAYSNRTFKKHLESHGYKTHKSNIGIIVYCIIDPSSA
jgi:putative DNA primase/helicase